FLTAGQHPQDVEAVAALDDVTDTTRRYVLRCSQKQVGPSFGGTHSQLSALKRFRGIRRSCSNSSKVSTTSQARQNLLCLGSEALDLGTWRSFGHRDQDLRQTQHARRRLLRLAGLRQG